MQRLFKERKILEEEGKRLPSDKVARLKELNTDYGDLHQQSFEFVDDSGNEFMVSVPNLALLPIKPLAINEAEFSYEFQVETEKTEKWTQGGQEGDRPWYLIKEPKSIRGNFATSKEDSSKSTIKVSMKIGATEMPYGLEKLMVHLTNSIETIDKEDD